MSISSNISSSTGGEYKSRPATLSISSTELGHRVECKSVFTTGKAFSMPGKVRWSLWPAAGRGNIRRTASVITPKVPHDPIYSLHRSIPATFFIVLPPVWIMSPLGVTAVMPRIRSRAVPYDARNGPLALVASAPPIVVVST